MSLSGKTELMGKIRCEIEPFLDKIRATPKEDLSLFKESYQKFEERYEKSMKIIEHITVGYLLEVKGESPVVGQIFSLFSYLGFVESVCNTLVDILVMVLVANGRDFHIESLRSTPRIKHALVIDDLTKEYVPLGTKLNFLRDNGMENFVSVVDSSLRNDIAHLNFEIDKHEIKIRKKSIKEIIYPCALVLSDSVTTVDELLRKLSKDLGW